VHAFNPGTAAEMIHRREIDSPRIFNWFLDCVSVSESVVNDVVVDT
jgi:hypothetical protein